MDWNTHISRRAALGAAATAPLLGAGAFGADAATAREASCAGSTVRSDPQPVTLAGPALLDAFTKLRARTDGRISIGWMDAVTYAFIEGETFPLYRLFAATWCRYRRVSPDRFEGSTLEIAMFHDIDTGEPLATLRMPRTGQVVDVPRYRAGPSKSEVVLHLEDEQPFGMARETTQGGSFFRPGVARRRVRVSEPERDGATFRVREDLETRVIPGDPNAPGFFYREWTIRRGPWDVVMDPRTTCAPAEVIYTGMAAFRPWMKMAGVPGHTVQNGVGAKVERVEELPTRILELCRKHHPDLVNEPDKALTLPAA